MLNFRLKAPRQLGLKLRSQLLLLSITLLVIPWSGYQYINAMETHLRKGQEESFLATARAVSLLLDEKVAVFFRPESDTVDSTKDINYMYVPSLSSAMRVDGYDQDWEDYKSRFREYGKDHVSGGKNEKYDPNSISFSMATGTYKNHLYVIFKVKDDKIVYRSRKMPNRLDRGDHLRITIKPKEQLSLYLFTTYAPSRSRRINAYYMPDNNPKEAGPAQRRIWGKWRESSNGSGYIIELRIPLSMLSDKTDFSKTGFAKINFAIADVDDTETREIKTIVSTAASTEEELSTLMIQTPEKDRLLRGIAQKDVRTWIIDTKKHVIAHYENQNYRRPQQKRSFLSGLMRIIYHLVLERQETVLQHERTEASSQLSGEEIDKALKGKPSVNWRRTANKRSPLLSAAYPIWQGKEVVGAVVMEKSSNSILILQDQALEDLFNASFLVFVFAATALLLFATRLSGRIRRLRDDAECAIGPDGRVRGKIAGSKAGDELGDLSRSVSDILERLGQYNRYLESMASKLSHELRTPLTVVKSSLENLEMQNLDKDAITYTERAKEGVDRLSNILTRMSEVTRLEQSLQIQDREEFKMDKVIKGCVEGYKIAYQDQAFNLDIEHGDYTSIGVPDLIAQMLDKLVTNARDFSDKDYPIRIRLRKKEEYIVLTVNNKGPLLPSEMQGNLFDSMVSVRKKQHDKLHLGLGLYIVRLIVDFHNGIVSASNIKKAPTGVKFTIILPSQFDEKKAPA